MKKLIPFLIAIVLIAGIVFFNFGRGFLDKYTYSDEKLDLSSESYFNLKGDEAAILYQNEIMEEKALVRNGEYYLTYDMICDYFIASRLYVNEKENTIRYVLPDRILSLNIGEDIYKDGEVENVTDYPLAFYENDTLYVAVDFVRLFTVFDYETFSAPNRISIHSSYSEQNVAEIKKDTKVRQKGGVKSPILTDIGKGAEVVVLEAMENWSKVMTEDAIIGYVENKMLTGERQETPTFMNGTSQYGDLVYTGVPMDKKVCLGWHQMGAAMDGSGLAQTVENTKGLNVISPTWFYLYDSLGNIKSKASKSYVDAAHQMGLQVWALADDFTENVNDFEIFSSSETRETLINNLIAEVEKYDIDGLNIDFEKVDQETGRHFVQFIRELSVECRLRGVVLSVDNYPPSGGTIWYNRGEQSVFVDYIINMGYDEHWSTGGKAGSVASIDFVEGGIKDTLAYVPAEKLINAVPFYTRVWQTSGTNTTGESVTMSVAKNFVENNGITLAWNEETCQNYGEVQKEDTTYQIWMEDYDSLKVKIDVMKTYDLAGIAAWKLGQETPDVWELIENYVNGQ